MRLLFLSLILSIALAQFDISISILSQDPLVLNFTLSNPQSAAQTFLQWGTPFEGVSSDMFTITDEQNTRLKYLGKIVLRGEDPIEEEFVTVEAGGSVSMTVDLGENYEFVNVGKYVVRVDLPEYCLMKYSATDSQAATVIELKTVPEGRKFVGAPQGYTNCASTEISYANAAVSGGSSESAASYNCLSAGTCDTSYSKWFGTYTATNYNYVSNCFYNVYYSLQNEFNGHCHGPQCSANTYAYVYPSDSGRTVYLCSLFFQRSAERNRVIVHEMSHFSSICGTQDYTYGQTACLDLARNDPNRACRNADNVCYFASIGK